MTQTPSPGMAAAAEAVELAQGLVDSGCAAVRDHGGVDANQVVAYDVAHAAAAVASARATLTYGDAGQTEELLATAFVAAVFTFFAVATAFLTGFAAATFLTAFVTAFLAPPTARFTAAVPLGVAAFLPTTAPPPPQPAPAH